MKLYNFLMMIDYLCKKYPHLKQGYISSGHDEIFIPGPDIIDDEDKEMMDKLKFMYDEEFDCLKCFI